MQHIVFTYFLIMSILLIYSTLVGTEYDPFDVNLRKNLKERQGIDLNEDE